MRCKNCGTELKEGVLFCRECGCKVEKVKKFCRECGSRIEPGAKFCSNCGAQIEINMQQDDVPSNDKDEVLEHEENEENKENKENKGPIILDVNFEVKHDCDDNNQTESVSTYEKDDRELKSNEFESFDEKKDDLMESKKEIDSNDQKEVGKTVRQVEKKKFFIKRKTEVQMSSFWKNDESDMESDSAENEANESNFKKLGEEIFDTKKVQEKLNGFMEFDKNKVDEFSEKMKSKIEESSDQIKTKMNDIGEENKDKESQQKKSSKYKEKMDEFTTKFDEFSESNVVIRKIKELWTGLDKFEKFLTIAALVVLIQLISSLIAHNNAALIFTIIQIICEIVAFLMHKKVIKTSDEDTKNLVLLGVLVFSVINIFSYSWVVKTPTKPYVPKATPKTTVVKKEQSVEKGKTIGEKVRWKEIKLSNVIPEPKSDRMKNIHNRDEWLHATVLNTTEDEFSEYVEQCKDEYGFTEDKLLYSNYFRASNQDGSSLALIYDVSDKAFSINLVVVKEGVANKSETDGEENLNILHDDVTENETDESSSEKEEAEKTKKEEVDTGKVDEKIVNPKIPKQALEFLNVTEGMEYASVFDDNHIYIATVLPNEIIKIDNWDKLTVNAKYASFDYNVGEFSIEDTSNGFSWIDDSHTAFVINLKDKKNPNFKDGKQATFTINVYNDSDALKGTDLHGDIPSYEFSHDDHHLYVAIPLNDNVIKLESWYRGGTSGSYVYNNDVFLIDTTSNATDFTWTDVDHTAFTITMKDPNNTQEWKDYEFAVFVLKNRTSKFDNVYSYMKTWEVHEGEAAIPGKSIDFKYEDYHDVKKQLEKAGFSNITTKIKYDIYWGWTSEGEVDSVTVNGRSDYLKREVFAVDAPIVITYHMKIEDDPANKTKEDESSNEASIKNEERDAKEPPVSYSTNPRSIAKNGNEGVYSYKSINGSYDIYWIIDFDEGNVYYFTEGNGNGICDKVKIESGTLNDTLKITYHDGDDTWSYWLHFKYVNQPEHLIMNDDYSSYDYYTTNLNDALAIRDTKRMVEY